MLRKLFSKFRGISYSQAGRILPVDKSVHKYDFSEIQERSDPEAAEISEQNVPEQKDAAESLSAPPTNNIGSDLQQGEKRERLQVFLKPDSTISIVSFLKEIRMTIKNIEGAFADKITLQLEFVEFRLSNEYKAHDEHKKCHIPLLFTLKNFINEKDGTFDSFRTENASSCLTTAIADLASLLQTCTSQLYEPHLSLDDALAAMDIMLGGLCSLVELCIFRKELLRPILAELVHLLSVYQDDTLLTIGGCVSDLSKNLLNQIACHGCQLLYALSTDSRRAFHKLQLSVASYVAEIFTILQRLSTILIFTRKISGNFSDTPYLFFWQACESIFDHIVLAQFQERMSSVWDPNEKRVAISILSNITINCLDSNGITSEDFYKSSHSIINRTERDDNQPKSTLRRGTMWKKFNVAILGIQFMSRILIKEADILPLPSNTPQSPISTANLLVNHSAKSNHHNELVHLLLETLLSCIQPARWESEDAVKVAQVMVNNLLMVFSSPKIDADMKCLTLFEELTIVLETFVKRWKSLVTYRTARSLQPGGDDRYGLESSMEWFESSVINSPVAPSQVGSPLPRLDSARNSYDAEEQYEGDMMATFGTANVMPSFGNGNSLNSGNLSQAQTARSPNHDARALSRAIHNSFGHLLHSSSYRENLYSVGENVDGLFTLKNGTKRWFPGQITAVTTIQTDGVSKYVYSMKYQDGEEQINKDVSEIRATKSRRNSNSSIKSVGSTVGALQPLRSMAKTASQPLLPSLPRYPTVPSSNSAQNTERSHPLASSNNPKAARSTNDLLQLQLSSISQNGIAGSLMNEETSESPRSVVVSEESRDKVEEEEEDDDSCENIFEIPSVFGDVDKVGENEGMKSRKISFVDVPKIEFGNVDLTASAPMPSAGSFSLSSALLREQPVSSNGSKTMILHGSDVSNENSSRFSSQYEPSTTVRSPYNSAKFLNSKFNSGTPSNSIASLHNLFTSSGHATHNFLETRKRNSLQKKKLLVESFNKGLQRESEANSLKENQLLCWAPVFVNVSTLILRRCILRGQVLDTSSCFPKSHQSYNKNTFTTENPPTTTNSNINITFTLREFFESEICSVYMPQVASFTNQCDAACTRLLKLLASPLLKSCLLTHGNKGEKIGSGGFGSVHRITCPADCKHCSSRCHKEQNYAVKRLPRERSDHDRPVIVDVFTEISCLEKLSGDSGICKLVDFGVSESEYWLILEQGYKDLAEWRHLSPITMEPRNTPLEAESGQTLPSISVKQLYLYCCLYEQIIRIVQSVHAAGIVHYDLKCSNFILRTPPTIESLTTNTTPGPLFLTDFGESLVVSDVPKDGLSHGRVYATRSRGTLPIQSPEVIRLNETTKSRRTSRDMRENTIFASDVWSLGCLLVELITGRYLFESKPWSEMYVMLCLQKTQEFDLTNLQNLIQPVNADVWTILSEVLQLTLKIEPSQRGSIFHIDILMKKLHPIFNRILSTRIVNEPNPTPPPLSATDSFSASILQQLSETNESLNNKYNESDRLNETVTVPSGIWDFEANVLFECSWENPIEPRELYSQPAQLSDLLFSRIDEVETLSRSPKLEQVVRMVVERKIEHLRQFTGQGILSPVDGKLFDVVHVVRLNNQQELSVTALSAIFKEACMKLDLGCMVIVGVEVSPDGESESASGDRDKASGRENAYTCPRKVLSAAVALAYSLANRNHIQSVSIEDYMCEIKKIIPWMFEQCSKELLVFIYSKMKQLI